MLAVVSDRREDITRSDTQTHITRRCSFSLIRYIVKHSDENNGAPIGTEKRERAGKSQTQHYDSSSSSSSPLLKTVIIISSSGREKDKSSMAPKFNLAPYCSNSSQGSDKKKKRIRIACHFDLIVGTNTSTSTSTSTLPEPELLHN